jgi:hypothetical protein
MGITAIEAQSKVNLKYSIYLSFVFIFFPVESLNGFHGGNPYNRGTGGGND